MENRKADKLKIVYIHWGFPPIIGGVETHLSFIGPNLVKRGYKVDLLTGLPEGAKIRENYKGMNVFRSPLFDLNWLNQRGFEGLDVKVKSLLVKYLNKLKPDIIHVHNMHYFSVMHISIIDKYAKSKKIPLVLTAHNVWDDGLFLDLIRKIRWSHIIAVSKFIKEELCSVGVPENKITVIYHGVNTNVFKPRSDKSILKDYPQLKGKKIIFHPARMGLAKGCDISIKSLKYVIKEVPQAMLVLCGTKNIIDWGSSQQKDIAYMLHLAKDLKLEKNIFIDAIPHNLIYKFYNVTSASIYPSTAGEPFGITMLESLSSGVPMIITNSGGMPEVVKDNINGFVIRIRDYRDLARKIILLLKDNELRQRFGDAGRKMILNNFTTEKMTDNTVSLYHDILKKRQADV